MQVFISWSGDLSQGVAELLASWIPDVLQGTRTWISNKDIDKGATWFNDIQNALQDVGAGILCVTRDNMNAPWLLFEAGALSKGLTKTRVIPLLIDLKPADLRPPLAQFNGCQPTIDDMVNMMLTINKQNRKSALTEASVRKTCSRWWKDFDEEFRRCLNRNQSGQQPKRRQVEDMIEETLQIARSIHQALQALTPDLRNPNTSSSARTMPSEMLREIARKTEQISLRYKDLDKMDKNELEALWWNIAWLAAKNARPDKGLDSGAAFIESLQASKRTKKQ